MNIQQRIVNFVSRSNWLLLLISSLTGVFYFSNEVTIGIAAGGLIVTINFHLLAKTLKKSFSSPQRGSVNKVLVKYYIRFFITGVVIYLLIKTNFVDPIGLIVGLSVVVVSMMLATMNEVRQLLCKEAG